MTRPLTMSELALVATPIGRQIQQDSSFRQFLIANVCRGTGIGVLFAALVLLTDAFGIFTLIAAQPAPITTALIFVLVCSVKFIAIGLAVAVGLAAHSK